jgi:RNA polymerase sigma-70 factor (ECF subfamily)
VVGLSAEETAEAVGSTPGAVRVAQHRALTQLRKLMAAEDNLAFDAQQHGTE